MCYLCLVPRKPIPQQTASCVKGVLDDESFGATFLLAAHSADDVCPVWLAQDARPAFVSAK